MSRQTAGAAVSVERFFQLSLLALVTTGFLAVAGSGHLDVPTIALTSAAFTLRALTVLGIVRFSIPDGAVTALMLAYIGFFPIDYLYVSGSFVTATVHLLFFLAAVRVLTARTTRDHLYTAILSFLELLAAAILSANPNFFVFLALYLLAATCAFMSAEIRRSIDGRGSVARGGLRFFHPRLATLASAVTVGVLLLTAGLFFLLPRTADAAFRHLISQRHFLPGFSNSVSLGQIGEIRNSSRPVMHVRIYTQGETGYYKWRGATLTNFDGKRWFNPPENEPARPRRGVQILTDDDQRRRQGRRVEYRVDLHDIDTDALFFAGIPEFLNLTAPTPLRALREGWRLGFVPSGGFRYEASSFVGDAAIPDSRSSNANPAAPAKFGPEWQPYLQLPNLDPRIAALARELVSGETVPSGQARALERALRTKYGYTIELLEREVPDPLAHFLFERRKGHCEYFASAMTVMLRSLGIPSRMVNGFHGGTYNPYSDLWVIRASDAHSWVEAYFPGLGWATFDPTPPDLSPRPASLWAKASLFLDAAETFWSEWVLSYDLGRQVSLVDQVERSSRRWRLNWVRQLKPAVDRWQEDASSIMFTYGPPVLAGVLLSWGGWFAGPKVWRLFRVHHVARRLRRGQASVADATVLYDRMLELLSRRGFQKPAWYTANEFAATLPDGDLSRIVRQFSSAYNAVRFGGQSDAAPELTRLLEILEQES